MLVQAASSAASDATKQKAERRRMIWVFLEIGLAIVLAVLIVWWTLRPARDRERKERGPDA